MAKSGREEAELQNIRVLQVLQRVFSWWGRNLCVSLQLKNVPSQNFDDIQIAGERKKVVSGGNGLRLPLICSCG